MSEYPQNRIYVVIPVDKVNQYLTGVLEVARYSNDKKFIIWDFAEGDMILERLRINPDIQLFTHAAILHLMATKEWTTPESEP